MLNSSGEVKENPYGNSISDLHIITKEELTLWFEQRRRHGFCLSPKTEARYDSEEELYAAMRKSAQVAYDMDDAGLFTVAILIFDEEMYTGATKRLTYRGREVGPDAIDFERAKNIALSRAAGLPISIPRVLAYA